MRASIVSLSLVLAAVPAALVSSSCGSSSGGAPTVEAGVDASGCGYKSTASLTMPTVSFNTDVLPIFEHSCGLSSACHYDPSIIKMRGIFLGCDPANSSCGLTAPVAPQVYPHLVGPMADKPIETTAMPYITPGNPSKSYLMHKMDDDLCSVTGCVAMNAAVAGAGDTPGSIGPNQPPNWCGTFMPYNVAVLDPATRDTVRRWIAQGAMNN